MESCKAGACDSVKEAEWTNLPFVIKYFRNVSSVNWLMGLSLTELSVIISDLIWDAA